MRTIILRALATTALPAVALIPAQAAFAQASDQAVAEDTNPGIIVTARKLEESLQDVPVAITAFDAETIKRRSISELEDVALQTPGLVFEDFSNGGFGTPTIRGATQFSIASLEQNVSVLLDGIYIPRQYAFDIGSSNLERIEVVKGPQSALYGANAFAGAINYVTSSRSLTEISANGKLEVSENGGLDVSGALSVPLIDDRLAMRLALGFSEFDGDFDNNHPDASAGVSPGTDEDIGGYSNRSLQVGASFKPIDALTIDFDYYNFDVESETRAQYRLSRGSGDFNCSDGGQFTNPGFQLFCGELPSAPIPGASGAEGFVIDPRTFGLDGQSEFYRVSVEAELTDQLTLNYLYGNASGSVFSAGGSDRDSLVPTVFGGATGNAFTFNPVGFFDYDSHELRLSYQGDGGFFAEVGGFYQDGDDFDNGGGALVPFRDLTPITALPAGANTPNAFTNTESKAVFGRLNIPLLDEKLNIELEGRYTDETITRTDDINPPAFEDSYFTPRFAVSYKVTPDNLIYASAARGVKSGGVNSSSAVLTDEEQFFGADTNWSFEIGSKNTFLDGRATLNVAAFYIDWSNLQLQVAPTNAFLFFTTNIVDDLGGASSKGIEIDGTVEPVDGLTFNAGFAYIDATYDDGVVSDRITRSNLCGDGLVCNADGDIGGNDLQRTSDIQWNIGAEYAAAVSDDFEAFGRVDVAGQSDQFVSELNATTIPSRTLVNARVGVSGDNWSASLWAKNLFDEVYVSNAFFIATPFFTDYVPTLGNRRRVGATLTFDY